MVPALRGRDDQGSAEQNIILLLLKLMIIFCVYRVVQV